MRLKVSEDAGIKTRYIEIHEILGKMWTNGKGHLAEGVGYQYAKRKESKSIHSMLQRTLTEIKIKYPEVIECDIKKALIGVYTDDMTNSYVEIVSSTYTIVYRDGENKICVEMNNIISEYSGKLN